MSVHVLVCWTLASLTVPCTLITASGSTEIAYRDKSGTSEASRITAGSQTLGDQALTSLDLLKAEGKGLEPSTPCGATDFESVS